MEVYRDMIDIIGEEVTGFMLEVYDEIFCSSLQSIPKITSLLYLQLILVPPANLYLNYIWLSN